MADRFVCALAALALQSGIPSGRVEAQGPSVVPAKVDFTVRVMDPSGAVVPHASLHLTPSSKTEKDLNGTAATDGSLTRSIATGTYRLCATAPGFATSCNEITVRLDRRSAEIRLAVSPTSAVISVQPTAEPLTELAPLQQAGAGFLSGRSTLLLPFSVHAFSASAAARRGAQTVADALEPDSSVVLTTGSQSNSPFYEQIYSRGLAVNNYTGVAVDGLFGLAGTLPVLEPVKTIEHIDGPATFLTGAPGNVGGVFNLRPKRAEGTLLELTPEYMSRGVGGGHGDLSRRFVRGGMFGARATNLYRAGSTEIDRNRFWQTANGLALDMRTERASASFDLQQDRTLNRGYSLFATFANGVPVTSAPSGHIGTQLPWMEAWDKDLRVLGRGTLHLRPNWDVQAGAGHTEVRFEYGGYCQATLLNVSGQTSCLPIQAANIAHITSVDAGTRWHTRSGPFRHEVYAGYDRLAYPTDTYGTLILTSAPLFFNLYSGPRPSASLLRAARPASYLTSAQSTDSGIAADTVSFAHQRVQVTAGVRYTALAARSYAASGTRTANTATSAWTPSVGVVWRALSAVSVYGNYIEALEPAAMPPATAQNAGTVFPALRSHQLEAGVKMQRGAWSGEAAAFRIERANQYLDTATNVYTQNGLQRNAGVDGSLSWRPSFGGLVQVSATGLSAVLERTSAGTFDGKHAPAVPSFTFRAYVGSPVPGTHRHLSLGNAFNLSGSVPFENSNARTVPGWFTLSPAAVWSMPGEHGLEGRLTVGNAAGERYWMGAGNGLVSIGSARFYQASFRKRFR